MLLLSSVKLSDMLVGPSKMVMLLYYCFDLGAFPYYIMECGILIIL